MELKPLPQNGHKRSLKINECCNKKITHVYTQLHSSPEEKNHSELTPYVTLTIVLEVKLRMNLRVG